jgi:hypothetical protein
MPASTGTRVGRLVSLAMVWAVTMRGPAASVLLGLLALVDAELDVHTWELRAPVRLPAPPWNWLQVQAILLLGLGAALFLAMAAHLAGDFIFAGECPTG